MKLSELKPDQKNPRKHGTRNLDLIEKSLRELGAARSIVIDEDNNIIAGNGTVEGAIRAGMEDVQIVDTDGTKLIAVRVSGKTAEEKTRLAILDNQTAALAEWDVEVLKGLSETMDLSEMFTGKELVGIGIEEEVVEDEVPETPKVAMTVKGDLYELGLHRVLCGDSTNSDDVRFLMKGEKADMVFTDPPYGVGYDGGHATEKRREKLAGDETTDLYEPCCNMAFSFSTEDAPLYLWHAGVKGIAAAAAAAAAAAGYEIRCEIVWNKNQAQYGAISAQYKQKHEPCYYCYKKGETVNWVGPTNEITVWDVDRASVNEYHPTQKPVGLAVRAINNHSAKFILDLFLGSGSTLIAAEQTKRICYGMEISENYCDVIVSRYVKFTGNNKIKLNGKEIAWEG